MNGREETFFIKDGCSPKPDMLQFMHPGIVMMIAYTNLWCISNGVKPVWTSWMRTAEENKALDATNSHIWRAADLSIDKKHGWTSSKVIEFKVTFSGIFKRLGAYAHSEAGRLIRRPIIVHNNGNGKHIHIQVNPYASIDHLKGVMDESTREVQKRPGKRKKDSDEDS